MNRGLFHAAARGMGVLNYKNDVVSGERRFLQDVLGRIESPIVFDVGANEGDYTDMVLKVNRGARVVSFEPHPLTYARLRSRFSGTAAVTAVNSGCGEIPGEFALYDYATSSGSGHASLHRGIIESIHGKTATEYAVKVIDIDSYCETNGISAIHLLKIDTEGNELAVLKGAGRMLREGRISAIQFEFNEMNVVSRVFFKELRDWLADYAMFRMVRDGLVSLEPYSPLWCEVFAFQNIVALLKNRKSIGV